MQRTTSPSHFPTIPNMSRDVSVKKRVKPARLRWIMPRCRGKWGHPMRKSQRLILALWLQQALPSVPGAANLCVHLNEGACELQHFLLCNGIRFPFSFCISCFQPNHMLVFWPRICAKQWWIMVVCCPYIFRPSLGASLLSISLVLGQFLWLADHRRHSKT